jgi:CHAT domain-containing protein
VTGIALLLALIATCFSVGFARLAFLHRREADKSALLAEKSEFEARMSAETAIRNEQAAQESEKAAINARQLAERRELMANRNLALSLAEQAERAWATGDVFAAQAVALKALHFTDSADIKARCLAIHYLIQGDKDQARKEFESLLDAAFEDMFQVDSPLHRVQRLTRTSATRPILDNWLALENDASQVYKQVLRFQGLSERIEQRERVSLRNALDLTEFRARLARAEANLAHFTYFGRKNDDVGNSWNQSFEARTSELAQLYQMLSSRSDVSPRTQLALFTEGPDRLRSALEKNEAIIHFALSRGKYFAWVIQSNYPIVQIPIGAAAEVDAKVKAFTDAVATSSIALPNTLNARGITVAIERDERSSNHDPNVASTELRRILWDPIAKEIGSDVSRLYVIPDGIFWTVPLYAIPCGESEALIDRFTIIHLLTPLDLVNPPQWTNPGSGILLIGDPDFYASPQDQKDVVSPSPLRQTFTRGNFVRLPGTLSEVTGVDRIVATASNEKVVLLTERDASEQAVRARSSGFRVMHFATHGWATSKLSLNSEVFKDRQGRIAADVDAHLLSLDPSLLSGVALAGANRGGDYEPESPVVGLDDGVLTAMEAASLSIDGVELVVLSGCETVGVALAGQSLFGLVGGFRVAGAKSVVASLFAVGDEATARLMEEFYRSMLTDRVGPATALRNSCLKLKREGASPRVWASFVSFGDLKSAPFLLKSLNK